MSGKSGRDLESRCVGARGPSGSLPMQVWTAEIIADLLTARKQAASRLKEFLESRVKLSQAVRNVFRVQAGRIEALAAILQDTPQSCTNSEVTTGNKRATSSQQLHIRSTTASSP